VEGGRMGWGGGARGDASDQGSDVSMSRCKLRQWENQYVQVERSGKTGSAVNVEMSQWEGVGGRE